MVRVPTYVIQKSYNQIPSFGINGEDYFKNPIAMHRFGETSHVLRTNPAIGNLGIFFWVRSLAHGFDQEILVLHALEGHDPDTKLLYELYA